MARSYLKVACSYLKVVHLHVKVAMIAAFVFIGTAVLVLSTSPAGLPGTVTSSLLAIAWLTACCSLAGLALSSIRR